MDGSSQASRISSIGSLRSKSGAGGGENLVAGTGDSDGDGIGGGQRGGRGAR